MPSLSATYSPDDNKLRLYATARLDEETYRRVRAAGFVYAPRQELFVAPAWSPHREDLLLELCGEIGDEDTTLVDRAEARAERLADRGERRAAEAEGARAAVHGITRTIPFGQPILAGHHSEGRARRDAARIDAGMRATVRLWEASAYWAERAAAAVRHARYKEQPAVRHRRIRGLESDQRKHQRDRERAEQLLTLWLAEGLTRERALVLANHFHGSFCFTLAEYPRALPASQYEGEMGLWSALEDGIITAEQARDLAVPVYRSTIAWSDRWLAHLALRLTYERAMLDEQGGIVADRTRPERGGACRCWASPRGGWSFIQKVNRVSVTVLDNWGNGGASFTRTVPFDKLSALMTRAEVDAARAAGRVVESEDGTGFFLREAADPEPETATGGDLGLAPAA